MKLIYLILLRHITILIFIWTLISGLFSVPTMFIDFPCHERYYKEQDCIGLLPDNQEYPKFDSYLSTFYANAYGGGCNHKALMEDSFSIYTSVGNLIFQLFDNSIKVNGKTININEHFQKTNYFGLNFWTTSYVKFDYKGKLAYCIRDDFEDSVSPNITKSDVTRHVIEGEYGTNHSILKGIIILIVLICSFIFLTREIEKVKNLQK